MGEIIQFNTHRLRKIAKEQMSKCDDNDLSARIDRIKASIARINQLMAELRDSK